MILHQGYRARKVNCSLIFYFKMKKEIGFAFLFLAFGKLVNAQKHHEQADSVKVIKTLKVRAVANRKIESDLKMAVSVDEFLASSDQISWKGYWRCP